jgi:long-chain acyl-CoA synthetase
MSTSIEAPGLIDRVPSELRSPGVTIIDVFWDRARSGRGQPALHWSSGAGWQAMTWADYAQAVSEVALALRELGLRAGDRVGILAGNRPEWHIVDVAILASGMVSVPVYATNAANQVAYVLQHSGARACFVEDDDQLAKVLLHRGELTALQHVVVIEPAEPRHDGFAQPLSQLRALGAAKQAGQPDAFGQLVDALSPSDLATIVYTSGTTGRPKGAMITHANLMATMRSLTSLIELRPTDRFLSFLPLSHITERCVSHFGQLASGGQTWFARSLATVATDLQTCRPTLFFAVPRVWEKFRDGVLEHVEAQHGVRRALAERYLAVTTARDKVGHRGALSFATEVQRRSLDAIVGRAIRRQLGLDKARILSCGAAPVHPGLLRWFHAIGLPIAEGYGQTEVSLCTSLNPAEAIRIGTVGRPIPGVSVRIAADGEILVKGPNVCVGYWHDKAATNALIDRDGWLHTGDLGSVDDLGYLSVSGRKKDLIITAYGKNIQPEEIETRLRVEPLISQAVVVGDDRPYLTALLTIDTQAAAEWAEREGRSLDPEALTDDDGLRQAVGRSVDRANADHAHAEGIKRWVLLPGELTIAGGELTPTLKVKRNVVVQRYQELIDELYASTTN